MKILVKVQVKKNMTFISYHISFFKKMDKPQATQFVLNSDKLKYLPFDNYDKNFTFIVNNKEYKTSRIVADILSPVIQKYHKTDETIDTFTIDIEDMNSNHDFSEVLSLLSFESREISEEESDFFRKIFFLLGNDEEYAKLYPKFQGELTVSNVFNVLQERQRCLRQRPELLASISSAEIEFISGHFFEIDESELKKLGIDIIEEVVKNRNLHIDNEDSLLKFLIEIYKEDQSASFLFDYVIFGNVSREGLLDFYEAFDLNDIDNEVWKMILDRSLNSVSESADSKFDGRYRRIGDPFLYEKGKEFNGIFRHLTEKTGGNIHNNGTIEVTSNSYCSSWEPWNLLDFDKENGYCANGTWDVWICFDFKEAKVKITNYSIKSINGNNGNSHHLKSWIIEVSDDGKKWTTIDEQKESQKLKGVDLTETFDVRPNEFSRYVRFKNTAEPWGGIDLWFNSLELYGHLKYNK